MLNQTVFEQWLELQEKVKKTLPAFGTILSCEDKEKIPHLVWCEERQLLSLSCSTSSKIVNDDGTVAQPYWVLAHEGQDVRGSLRAVVSKQYRDLWLKNKDKITVKQVKVVAHANNKRCVIVEFIL